MQKKITIIIDEIPHGDNKKVTVNSKVNISKGFKTFDEIIGHLENAISDLRVAEKNEKENTNDE
jgi:hypothetical protein